MNQFILNNVCYWSYVDTVYILFSLNLTVYMFTILSFQKFVPVTFLQWKVVHLQYMHLPTIHAILQPETSYLISMTTLLLQFHIP